MSEFQGVSEASKALGWDDAWSAQFVDASSGMPETPARVGRVDRGRYEVAFGVLANGELDATLAVMHASDPVGLPVTGDWVLVDRLPDGAVITTILPRRSAIVRASANGTSRGQVLAANIDTVLIAVPLDKTVNLNQLERFVTVAWESGAMPLVVLTKADLVGDPEEAVRTAMEGAPGVQVLTVSAETSEGMDELNQTLGATVAFIGASGAGKSTLVNALVGADVMATGATRSDGKGRHTTTTRELIARPGGGVLIDTPGLRGIGVHDASDGVAQSFSDITDLAEQCRFFDCLHQTEPGCAVLGAIEDGTLTQRRLDSYRKQLREIANAAIRKDAAARSAQAKEWAKRTKAGREAMAAKRRR